MAAITFLIALDPDGDVNVFIGFYMFPFSDAGFQKKQIGFITIV